jgi:hypothetical protein
LEHLRQGEAHAVGLGHQSGLRRHGALFFFSLVFLYSVFSSPCFALVQPSPSFVLKVLTITLRLSSL